jgi:ERCC4-type nuclease
MSTNMPEWLITALVGFVALVLGWLLRLIREKITEVRSFLAEMQRLSAEYNTGIAENRSFLVKMTELSEENNLVIKGIHKVGEVQAENVLRMKQFLEDLTTAKENNPEFVQNIAKVAPETINDVIRNYREALLDQGYSQEDADELARKRFHNDMAFGSIPNYESGTF